MFTHSFQTDSIMSSTDPAEIAKSILKRLTQGVDKPTQEVLKTISKVPDRAELLPSLFRVRGELYSLDNYPQFKEMYTRHVIPDTIYMCGRQLGKSMNLSRSEILDCLIMDHFQILYVAPLQQQTHRYSALYLQEAINSCAVGDIAQDVMFEGNDSDVTIVKALMHKSFGNGSGVQLTYAKTSSDRARGIYADRIDFDEIQDQLVDNIPIISESLTASKWGGIRRFTGTAKTTDNTIENLWQESSQSEWVMQCEHCNHWNIPTVDGKVLDMVRVIGPCCVRCGKRLNVRNGQFVAAYPDRVKSFKGLHIPQIVVPAITENPTKWSALFRKILRLPLPIILQEVMGISCSQGARIITQADIEKQSTLPTVADIRKDMSKYMFTVGGVDWGIAEHTSFTVHTIIGVKSDGTFDVIWAKRFIGFNPDEVMQSIAQAHMYYGCRLVGADMGMGFDKNYLLGTRFGLPVVQIQLVRQGRLLTYAPPSANSISRWSADKTTALELMFLAIKYGRIFFPPQSEFRIYTDDLLSPYEEIADAAGLSSRHFLRNPNRPDDFAMALCFACLVAMQSMGVNMAEIVPTDAMGAQSMPGVGLPPVQDFIDPKDILSQVR